MTLMPLPRRLRRRAVIHSAVFLLAILFSFDSLILVSSSSSASASASNSYVSVRALNEYGNAQQIQNALKAANLQGTLVVAVRNPHTNSTIVLSLLSSQSIDRISHIPGAEQPAMLQLVNNKLVDDKHCIQTALICTGMKGDAHWLVRKVREYSHSVWDRYNTHVDAPGIAHAVSKLKRRFWGYDEDDEWQASFLAASANDDDKSDSWARPLGVVTMVLSNALPYFMVVEPSGIIQRYTAFAMGSKSDQIMEKLGLLVQEVAGTPDDPSKHTNEELKMKIVDLVRDTLGQTTRDWTVLVEVLSDRGVARLPQARLKQ